MGLVSKVRKKFFEIIGPILALFFGEAVERFVEGSLIALLLKFWFGLTIKGAITIALIVVILTFMKTIYYKEDLYLAFVLLLIFQDSLMLSWLLYMYISYFRGNRLGPWKKYAFNSVKFSKLKSEWVSWIGQYVLPIGILVTARKNKELRESIIGLTLLAFWHHLNYFAALMLDIIVNRKEYSLKEAKNIIAHGLKESKINIIVTIVFLLIFKNLIIKYVYTDHSWGILDKIFEWLSWII